MIPVGKLQEMQTQSNSAIAAMERAVADLNALIDRLEADKSRSQAFTLEAVKAQREKALPALAAELKIIKGIAQQAAPSKKFWESRPLLLSLQPFNADDPAKDAMIRAGYSAELATMSLPLLQLAAASCCLRPPPRRSNRSHG